MIGLVILLSACHGNAAPGASDAFADPYTSGPIDEAQYVSIVTAVRSCMLAQGFDVGEVEMRPDGVTYSFTISGESAGDMTAHDVLLECEDQYNLMEAEIAYQDQQVLAGSEREAVFAEFAACLDAAGVSGVTSADSRSRIETQVAALADGSEAVICLDQYGGRLYGASG